MQLLEFIIYSLQYFPALCALKNDTTLNVHKFLAESHFSGPSVTILPCRKGLLVTIADNSVVLKFYADYEKSKLTDY